ncbi:MAG: ribonuclease E inhibitor RraB [Exiguobacterium sp.]|uniref:ribonuclease E inhibitor RraB n=1 Tax=Exiguobacterium TaxID=33986 RepID=UPI001BEAAC3F|nr:MULTISPECIES: ribonuclease E inhibitor RraB [Exiguobacterium]MCT4782359.1 ribonuclease E inhibitor RraB [Exiguobacterium himgiriensis]MDX5324011.1 ribonuclease E inhibitor RraB [Exiguobacterium sp.]MDX5425838.1 ribonuclease E inhibitor RraB [Exiguobacterium sp.]MDX6773229.1 ribonuclease E inhibitor RraB [Exiguobacterium sp.]
MKAQHTFRSEEREKLEIVASLLQQAGYQITSISSSNENMTFKATRDTVLSKRDEEERINQLVHHFGILSWSVTYR